MEYFTKIENLLLVVFATSEVLEIWNHSLLLARLRARVELWENFAGRLLRCMFCLAPWVALVLLGVMAVAGELSFAGHYILGGLILLPVAALAVARAANLLYELTAGFSRTPKQELTFSDAADPAGGSDTYKENRHVPDPDFPDPCPNGRNLDSEP